MVVDEYTSCKVCIDYAIVNNYDCDTLYIAPLKKPVYKFRRDNVNRSLLNTIAKHNPSKKSYILPKVIKR